MGFAISVYSKYALNKGDNLVFQYTNLKTLLRFPRENTGHSIYLISLLYNFLLGLMLKCHFVNSWPWAAVVKDDGRWEPTLQP